MDERPCRCYPNLLGRRPDNGGTARGNRSFENSLRCCCCGVQVRVRRRIGDLTAEHEPKLLGIRHRKNDVRNACFVKPLERTVDGALYLQYDLRQGPEPLLGNRGDKCRAVRKVVIWRCVTDTNPPRHTPKRDLIRAHFAGDLESRLDEGPTQVAVMV